MGQLPYKLAISVLVLAALVFWSEATFILKVRKAALGFFVSFLSAPRSDESVSEFLRPEERDPASLSFKIRILEEENAALRKALGFEKKSGFQFLESYAVGKWREFGGEYLGLNLGKESGVSIGDLVVTESGVLVGRVIGVGDNFSRVSLASNQSETLEVFVLPARIGGVARGLGARTLLLEFLPEDYLLGRGDMVFVSAALEGREAPFLLGVVNKIKARAGSPFQEVEIILSARPEFLRRVFVVLKK